MTTKAPQAPQPAADAPGTAVGQAGPRRAGEYPENTAAAGGGAQLLQQLRRVFPVLFAKRLNFML